MSHSFTKKTLSTAIAACLMAEAAPVLAQADVILEEIVVTARKREESIMKVPTTASVFSQSALEQYAIDDVASIADKTPGLNFNTGPVASGVLVSMRGIGTTSNNPAIDQSVALVADGMQFTQGLAYKAATFDLAQVEVLKGPQALFFGKAAPAGVISVTTADPGNELELILRGGYEFATEEKLGELIISGPVSDTLGLRLAAQYSEADGYFENNAEVSNNPLLPIIYPGISSSLGAAPVEDENFPQSETLLLRGTAVWEPTDNFSARLKLNYSDVDTQGTGGEPQLVSCPDGTDSVVFGALGLNFIGQDDCKANEQQTFSYLDPDAFYGIYNGGVPFSEHEQSFGSLELDYYLADDVTLTSVTGFYDVEQSSMINGSLTSGYGSPFAIQGNLERSDFTQEFRLTSDFAGPVNYTAGIFYQDSETDYQSELPFNQNYATLLGMPPILPGFDAVMRALTWQDHNVDSKTSSVFGQVLWDISPELELGVGARWTDEEREHTVMTNTRPIGGGLIGWINVPEELNLAEPELSSENWSPEVSLTYYPTDNLTVYGNIKQAYKSGSFDVTSATEGDDTSFGDEKITGGELGVKSRLSEGSLLLNAAAYYYQYDDLQVEAKQFNPSTGVVGVRTTNAASAEIYGIDVDATYFVPGIEGLTVLAALNWNIAEYDEFDNAECWDGQLQSEGCSIDQDSNGFGDAQDLSGEPLVRSPEWTATLGLDYERPVFNNMMLRLGSNTTYSSEYSASSLNLDDAYQDSYVKTSASVALAGPGDRWKVELIGDNLGDEIVYGNCAPTGYTDTILALPPKGAPAPTALGGPETACYTEPGRTALLRFTLQY